MYGSNFSSDSQPITWVRRVPVYATTIVTALLVLGMFATTILETARVQTLYWYAFEPSGFWQSHRLWTVLTYPFLSRPTFFFLFGVLMFYWFAVDVERYLGRKRWLQLLALLVLVPALLTTVWWRLTDTANYMEGFEDVTIGFFVAFATLYPNVEWWGWITMKWLAFAGITLSAMNYLPKRDWVGMTVLLTCCAISFGFIRWLQHGSPLPKLGGLTRLFKRKPKFRVMPDPDRPERTRGTVAEREEVDDINPLLDKIAKSGMASLTKAELARLEKARAALLKKDGLGR